MVWTKRKKISVPNTNQYQHQNQPDAFSSLPMLQEIRNMNRFPLHIIMTPNQIATYMNHHRNTAKYDQISAFSLQPPELLGVFMRPKDYFWFCYIDLKNETKWYWIWTQWKYWRMQMDWLFRKKNKATYNWNRRGKEYDTK